MSGLPRAVTAEYCCWTLVVVVPIVKRTIVVVVVGCCRFSLGATYLLETLRDYQAPILQTTALISKVSWTIRTIHGILQDAIQAGHCVGSLPTVFGVPPTLVAERSLALRLHLRSVVTILLDSLLDNHFDSELPRFQLPERSDNTGL